MAEELSRDPHTLGRYDENRRVMPEWHILRPVWRNLWWILTLSVLVGIAAYGYFARQVPIYPVRAELIVRLGYEYTPVPTAQGGESQQITFRLDEVIGSEIQLLTSLPLIARALEQAPYIQPASAAGRRGVSVQDVAAMIGVERVEGSTVLVLSVLDRNREWALRFLSTLIPLYFEERRRLYSQSTLAEMLESERGAVSQDLSSMRTESATVSSELASALELWDSGLASLARQSGSNRELVALESGFSALLVRLSGRASTGVIADRLSRYGSARDSGVFASETGSSADTSILRATLTTIEQSVEDVVELGAREAALKDRMAAIDASLQRLQVRAAASEGIAVLTPPYESERRAGLAPIPKSILAGVLMFLFSAMAAVLVSGSRNLR